MAFKHISLLWNKKGVIMGHTGAMVLLPGKKTHITPFGALGNLVFDSTYDMKQANLSQKNKW